MTLIALLQPQNIHQEKKRVGPLEDGGYVMPVSVLENCTALFTYGVGGETRYEQEFSEKYNKPVFMFDHTVGVPHLSTIDPNVTFVGEGLGFQTGCKDFLEHYKERNISGDVFLKIDIEGAEFDYFLAADLDEIAKVTTGINLEVHWIDNGENREKFILMLQRLQKDYVLCHIHANNWATVFPYEGKMVPIVMELSFINKRYVTEYEPDCTTYPIKGLDWPNRANSEDHKLDFLYWAPKANQNFYISLTTVPSRLANWDQIVRNLTSLVNQKTNVDYKVVLNIPMVYGITNEEYVLSENLLKFAEENPRLLINRIEKDTGPIVKITGILPIAGNPEDIIIVCDDDHVYHEDMFEYHLKKMIQYPNMVTVFRGDSIVDKRDWVENGKKKYALKPTHLYFPVITDQYLLIPGHWHSAGYRRKFFREDFPSQEYLALSVNDDVVMGYYLKKHRTLVICVAWDGETDFRPVNDYGKPCYTFPIVESLSFENSGFYEFRRIEGDHVGQVNNTIVKPFMEDGHFTIYEDDQ